MTTLTPGILEAAIEGLEAQKNRLDAQIAAIRAQLGTTAHDHNPSAASTAASPKPQRRLSAAGRKAIADAARKRWAEQRKANAAGEKAAAKKAVKPSKRAAAKNAKAIAKKTAKKSAKAVAAKKSQVTNKATAKKSGTKRSAAKRSTTKAATKPVAAPANETAPVQPEVSAPVQAEVVEAAAHGS